MNFSKANAGVYSPYEFNPKVVRIELSRFFECESYQCEALKEWMQAEEQYGTPSLDWTLEFEGTHAERFMLGYAHECDTNVFRLYKKAVGYYIDIPWLMPDQNGVPLFANEYASIKMEVSERLDHLNLYFHMSDLDSMCADNRNRATKNQSDRVISNHYEAVLGLRVLYEEILLIVAFFEIVENHRTQALLHKLTF